VKAVVPIEQASIATALASSTKSDKPVHIMQSTNAAHAHHGALATLPAREGTAMPLAKGQRITIVNRFGSQVVDTWAFNEADIDEFMSMEHSRAAMLKLSPAVGDTLVTNRRRPILTVVEDTTPGIHDTLIAACDRYRYQQLGGRDGHENCTDNLAAALGALGIDDAVTPSPLNLFMNVEATSDGRIAFRAPVSAPGQYVTLRAEMDLIIALSACPQDLLPVNGEGPTDVDFIVQI
jgi:uncharacterized protein